MTNVVKKPILNATIMVATLAVACFAAFDLVITVLLGQIDFSRCWDAIGSENRYISVDGTPYPEAIRLISNAYPGDIVDSFFFYILTYIPLFFGAWKAKKTKTKLFILLFVVLFSLHMWSDMGYPSDQHDCDRKAAEGGLIVFIAPILYFIPLSLISWITVKYFDREPKNHDGKTP